MKHPATRFVTAAITLSFAALPLAGCVNAPSANNGATSAESSATTEEASASETTAAPSAPVDTSSWATMAEALAHADKDSISYGANDTYFVCVFKAGDATIRTVSEMDLSKEAQFADIDTGDPEQLAGVVGNFKLISAQDISSELLSQSDIEAYVGKTGQELLDAGFVFQSYFWYGGEQTGAEMGKDDFSYNFTFDTQISENQTEDGGASIKDAKVVEAQSMGNLSNSAIDAELVDAK